MPHIVLIFLTVVGVEWTLGVAAVEREVEEPLDVESILKSPLTADDYRTSVRCISTQRFRTIEIVDERYILFIGRREAWLNRLRHRCTGLQPNMVAVLNMRSNRICHMDRLHGVSSLATTHSCSLGEFQEIEEFRIDDLKEAIMAHGRSEMVKPPEPSVDNESQ
jgi:hypothetical protein